MPISGTTCRLAGVLACVLVVACCGRLSPGVRPQPVAPSPPAASAPTPGASALSGLPGTVQRVDGAGWDATGLSGTAPLPGACHSGRAQNGAALPDRRCTPGAVDVTVTQGNLASTICRAGGYSESVRPPESVTEPFKRVALAAYAEAGPSSEYELDHLVPLGLGGASSVANLWPEPDDHPRPGFANSKDVVELELHDLVCAAVEGRRHLPLVTAQALIAEDWTTAMALARQGMVGAG